MDVERPFPDGFVQQPVYLIALTNGDNMSNKTSKTYEEYRREFRMLRESGLELCCPEDVEVSPGRLARRIAGDRHATYMRDTVFDGEGRPVKINFIRVKLTEDGC